MKKDSGWIWGQCKGVGASSARDGTLRRIRPLYKSGAGRFANLKSIATVLLLVLSFACGTVVQLYFPRLLS
jgi:hypothetical protein